MIRSLTIAALLPALAWTTGVASAIDLGTGADGSLTVSTATFLDTVRTSLSGSPGAGGTSLNVASAAGFAAGDEVLILNMQGPGAPGTFEFARVSGVSGNTINLSGGLANAYNGGADSVMVQRVPNFTNVTVQSGGTLTANAWNGTTGGVVAFRATGLVDVQSGGAISADALGFRGGASVTGSAAGFQGESFTALGAQNNRNPNDGGGGAGLREVGAPGSDIGGGAGGGSHATAGGAGGDNFNTISFDSGGLPGTTYGNPSLGSLFFGSGGGSGGHDLDTPDVTGSSGAGGRGGGVIFFHAAQLQAAGGISAAGGSGGNDTTPFSSETGGGGGGAGGSVLLATASSVSPAAALASGGGGGATNSGFLLGGGSGGAGYVNVNGVDVAAHFQSSAQSIDFTNNTVEDLTLATGFVGGSWNASGGGTTATNSSNSSPSIFYNDQNILNTRITGIITPGNDDDIVGLAFGFNPGDSSNPAADYLLLDWKGVTQAVDFAGGTNDNTSSSTAFQGLALSEVSGIPTTDELWGHVDDAGDGGGGLAELARALALGSTGYSTTGSHDFEIFYEDDRVRVFVDGVLQFDLAGTFGDGRLGLYELAQDPGATFANFSITPLEDIEGLAVPEPSSVVLWLLVAAAGAFYGRGLTRRRRCAASLP